MGKHRKNPDRQPPTYKVGYGVPPEEHRFQPGHSRSGRPRKRPDHHDLKAIARQKLLRKRRVTVAGQAKLMTYTEVVIEQKLGSPTGVHLRELKEFIAFYEWAFSDQKVQERDHVDYAAQVRKKLDDMAKRMDRNRPDDTEDGQPGADAE